MKRITFFSVLILILGIAYISFSQEKETRKDTGERNKILIDFNDYNKPDKMQNAYAESPKTKEEIEKVESDLINYAVTVDDMKLDNWIVHFNSSSDTFKTRMFSYTRSVKTRKGETVLGAKIHFPDHSFYSHAMVSPPYEIMEYNRDGKLVNIGNGIIDNVYQVKELSVEVSGRNYNNRLFLRVIDQNRRFRDFYLGRLNFAGWRRLIWKNPYYVGNVDQRPLVRRKLYPTEKPYYKFHSFIISRPEGGVRGDFVVYFKKVEVLYDRSSVDEDQLTIDDENKWGIRKRKSLLREAFLKKKNATIKQFRSIEAKRMGRPTKSSETKDDGKPADK